MRGGLAGVLVALGFLWGLEGALAAPATPVAPCVTSSSNASGVTIESCTPVTTASPLPVTVTGGGDAVTQGTTPWVDNVTQFGGSNIVTGTGVGGAGIPRVTVSSDSSLSIAPTSSSSLSVSHASVTVLGTALVAKASAGNLYSYNCTAITGGGAGFCIAYNGTAAPGTGALTGSLVLDVCYFAAGTAGCSLTHGTIPANYSAGVVILVTSAATPFTYTTGVDTAFISADYN